MPTPIFVASRRLSASSQGFAGLLLLCALGTGCAAHALPVSGATGGERRGATEPRRHLVRVPALVIAPTDPAAARELLSAGRRKLETGRYRAAASDFDSAYAEDPTGPSAGEALYLAAGAHDESGGLEAALARYERLTRLENAEPWSRRAYAPAVRLATHLERWPAAAALAEQLAARHAPLALDEEILVLGARALRLVEGATPEEATLPIEQARGLVEARRLDAGGRLPRDLAPVYFALGELRRLRAEATALPSDPAKFLGVLEQRCQALLDAQSAYSDVMRAYDAGWSARAGYRVAELYQRLHDDVMKLGPPASSAANDERKQLFEAAMRVRYSVLLRKALTMLDHTLAMAERERLPSPWVDRARDAKAALGAALQAEEAALEKLPYTREDLERAMDVLARGRAESDPPRLPARPRDARP